MLTQASLDQFTGTEAYHRYLMGINLTDGVKYMADAAGAWWLIDAVCSYQPEHRGVGFQVWELNLNGKGGAVLTMKEDKDKPALVTQRISFTTFPLPSIKLYLIGGVLLLPSEY